jgi:protein-disulfide isomerase
MGQLGTKGPRTSMAGLVALLSVAAAACATPGATSASASASALSGWTARAPATVNPHLALLEAQTRGATADRCVAGPDWPDDVPEERRLKPRVEILEFTDYQCPYCVRAQPALHRILEHFGSCTVRLTTVPKPLAFHPHAAAAARAAAAAALQGPQAHDRVHRVLFEDSSGMSEESLAALPKIARVDPVALAKGLEDPAVDAFVKWGVTVGDHSGARGTPTFFVNGHLVAGAQPFEAFASLVERELALSSAKEGRWGDRWLVGRLALNAPRLYGFLIEGREVAELEAEEEEAEEEENPEAAAPSEPEAVEVAIGANDPVRGNPSAPVTVVTFGEYQCPFCIRLNTTLKKVAEHYGDRVRFVAKHYPLPFHERARPAAKAAICAQAQGKFWEFHDGLYGLGTRKLEDGDIKRLAKTLKLDRRAFARCIAGKAADGRIDADIGQAGELGVRGTPSTFVNGFKLTGARDFSHFKALIDAAIGPAAGVE